MTLYERSLYEKTIHELEKDRDRLLNLLKDLLNEKINQKLVISNQEQFQLP